MQPNGSHSIRLLAIGDIHGCSRALDTLLDLVQPDPDDWIVTLGDYVDRGPDTRGVIERLLELNATGQLIPLRGNHEEMMLQCRTDFTLINEWLQLGGQETLDSYKTGERGAVFEDIPPEHWNFLESNLIDWFETDRFIFVHGGLEPKLPLERQPVVPMRWMKFADPAPHCSGKTVICGHTHQASGWPRNIGHAVCIDTWVYGAGWLTCLDVDSGQFWQANQAGETRTSTLAEHLVGRGS